MNRTERIYLDHAATSWPKSEAVLDAMDQFMRTCGAAAGRGGYRSAAKADQLVSRVRRQIASLIDAQSSECVSFHANGTAALNVAICGMVRPGDHVVVSAAEHNSVLRPLHHLVQTRNVRLTIVPVDASGRVQADEFLDAVSEDTRLAVLTHASNVTGAVQPVRQIGESLQNRSAFFLCDAAQTFGAVPVSVSEFGVDLLAAPGHKSSGGPLGTAFLYVAPRLHEEIAPLLHGGTGSQSESMEMPDALPARLEPGNLNVPAIAGWGAALDSKTSKEMEQMAERAARLASRLREGLAAIPHLTVHGRPGPLPIASLTIEGFSPTDAAAILDAEFGIETRAGMHCAAQIHQYLGTEPEGTLRISGGHTTTETEIDAVIDALTAMIHALHPN
jgi:cysteine desulfurase family protein